MRSDPVRDASAFKTASFVLFAAALYNAVSGAVAVIAPVPMLRWLGITDETHPELWQCIGMLVGVYAVGYGFASLHPVRYRPLVWVGLLGKGLGCVGAIASVASGRLPLAFLRLTLANDALWLLPFAWIVWRMRALPDGVLPTDRGGRPPASLYRRALGPDFDALSPRLRAFHDAATPVEMRGSLRILRGSSRIANWLADRVGFPATCDAVRVSLRVEPREGGEIWRRRFGESAIESRQERRRGQLCESFGPIVLYLAPAVRCGALILDDLRATFLGIPLPPFLTPRVHAHEIDAEGGVQVAIRITCPPFGLVVEYSGVVSPPDPRS